MVKARGGGGSVGVWEVFRLVHTVYNNIGCKQALQSGVSSEGMSADRMSRMRPQLESLLAGYNNMGHAFYFCLFITWPKLGLDK